MAQEILIFKLLLDAKSPIENIDELQDRVKLLRAALKQTPDQGSEAFEVLASVLSDKVGISIDEAKKKLVQLTDSAKKEVQEGTQTINEFNRSLRQVEPASNSIGELENQLKTARASMKLLDRGTQEFVDSFNEVKELEGQLRTLKRGGIDPAEGSINALRLESGKLARELDNINAETDEFTRKARDLKQVNDRINELTQSSGRFGDNIGNYKSAFDGLDSVFGQLGGNLSGSFGQISNLLGSAAAGPAGIAVAVGTAAVAIGGYVNDIVQEFVKLEGEVSRVTGATGDELNNFTSRIQAIATTFGEDFDQILLSAQNVSNELGITFTESLDLIEKGFLSGANANGEFLDGLREYTTFAREANASGEQLVETLILQAQQGGFSDKFIDSLKEATERIGRLEKNTVDSLEAIGLNVGDIQSGLEDGTIDIIDVVQQASQAISQLPEGSVQASKAIENIFGTPGIDAGRQLVEQFQNINGELDDYVDQNNRLTQAQQRQLEAETASNLAKAELEDRLGNLSNSFSNVGTNIETFFIRFLNGAIDIGIAFYDRALQPIVTGLSDLFSALGDTATAIGIFNEEGNLSKEVISVLGFAFEVASTPIRATFTAISAIVQGIRNAVSATRDFLNLTDEVSAQEAAIEAERQRAAEQQRQGFEAARRADDERRSQEAAAAEAAIQAEKEKNERLAAERAKAIEQRERDEKAAASKRKSEAAKLEKELEAAREQQIKDEAKAAENLSLLRASLNSDQVEKDIALAKLNADKKIAALIGSEQQIAEQEILIKRQLSLEVSKIEQEAAERQEALFEKSIRDRIDSIELSFEREKAALQSQLVERLQLITGTDKAANDERLRLQAEFELKIAEAEISAQEQKVAALQEGSADYLAAQQELNDLVLEANLEAYEKDKEAAIKAEEEKLEKRKELSDLAIEAATELSNNLLSVAVARSEAETAARLTELEERREDELESFEGTEEERLAIEERYNEERLAIEEEAFEQQQKFARLQAIINGALAITKILAETPKFDFGIATAIQIGLAAVTTAAQLAVINAQSFGLGGLFDLISNSNNFGNHRSDSSNRNIPSHGRGSFLSRGVPHSNNGGMPVIDPITGTIQAFVERYEAIMNKRTTSKYYDTLSLMNQDGGGVQFPGTPKLTSQNRYILDELKTGRSFGLGGGIGFQYGVNPSAINYYENGINDIGPSQDTSLPILNELSKLNKNITQLAQRPIPIEDIKRSSDRSNQDRINASN